MKGLILSGGEGTRLRPLTHTRAKQLLPLANKPMLFYVIETLLEAGIREIGIVVGNSYEEIKETVERETRWKSDIHFTFLYQDVPRGLADAVRVAQDFLGKDRFIMILGDNLIEESLAAQVQEFASSDCPYHCSILLKEVADPSQFGIAELEAEAVDCVKYVKTVASTTARSDSTVSNEESIKVSNLRVRRLIEKPKTSVCGLAIVGVYFLDCTIFEAIANIRPSARNELEITDAIQWLIDHGYQVRASEYNSYWADMGKTENLLEANQHILTQLQSSIAPSAVVSADSMLYGTVILQEGASVKNSIICGPAIIGRRSSIEDAYIGPFTSIYNDVVITASEIECSIVLEQSNIAHVQGRIAESLIGQYTQVYTPHFKSRSHRLILGGHSKVEINLP